MGPGTFVQGNPYSILIVKAKEKLYRSVVSSVKISDEYFRSNYVKDGLWTSLFSSRLGDLTTSDQHPFPKFRGVDSY